MWNKPIYQKWRLWKHPNWLIVIQVLKSVLKAIFLSRILTIPDLKECTAPVKPYRALHPTGPSAYQRPIWNSSGPNFSARRAHQRISHRQLYYALYWMYILVGGWPTPLKNMKVSWDHYSQYIGEKKCSKPPTSISRYMLNTYWIYSMAISRNLNWRYLPYIRPT